MNENDQKILKEFKYDTLSDLVFWSYRYFVGRRTIAATQFADQLSHAWPYLKSNIQQLIQRELDELFRRDDEQRLENTERGYLILGDDVDRAAWEKVRRAYNGPVEL